MIQFVGAILVILGRKAFGKQHSRNVIWSIIIYVIGGGFFVGAFLALIFSIIAKYRLNGTNPVPPPNSTSYFTPLFFDLILIAIAIQSIAHVLFTYALQKRNGRVLLWFGYASIVAASSVEFLACETSLVPQGTVDNGVIGILHGYFVIPLQAGATQDSNSSYCNAITSSNTDCTGTTFIETHFTSCYPLHCPVDFSVTTFFDHYAAGGQGLIITEWKNASADRGGNHGDIRSTNTVWTIAQASLTSPFFSSERFSSSFRARD